MLRGLPGLWIAIIILGMVALSLNGARFIGTKQIPRTKNLDFLPPPLIAQSLAMGQGTALAKLRWIDSFAYFQLQIDRQDDSVAGADTRGGFERLYDTLIALDPNFMPFYDHAVLNTGGVLKQHHVALSFLMRGLLKRPHDTHLWRLASAELAISFNWAKSAPAKLDRWLNAWADAESSDQGRQFVLDWRRGLALTNVDGLETLPYWLEQLRSTKPGTSLADFVEGTIREVLAEHGARELLRVVRDRPASKDAPFLQRILGERLLPRSTIELDAQAVVARWPQGLPSFVPIAWDGQNLVLRPDPFGWPWRWQNDRVVSSGQVHRRFLTANGAQRQLVEAAANAHGRPPHDRAEAAAWGVILPDPPDGGRWVFDARVPEVVWPDPPQEPWRLR